VEAGFNPAILQGVVAAAAVAGLVPAFAGIGAVLGPVMAPVVLEFGAIAAVAHALSVTLAGMVAAVGAVGAMMQPQLAMFSAALAMASAGLAASILPVAAAASAAGIALVMMGGGLAILGAGFIKLSMETRSFTRFKDAFEAVINKVVKALEPFWTKMLALAGLFDALVAVVLPLATAFANNEVAARIMFQGFKMVALALGGTALALGAFAFGVLKVVEVTARAGSFLFKSLTDLGNGIQNAIMSINNYIATVLSGIANSPTFGALLGPDIQAGLNGMANSLHSVARRAGPEAETALDGIASAAAAMQPDLEGMARALQELSGLTYDEALARAQALRTQQQVTESLSNVPSGYKVALARFEATNPQGGGSGVGGRGGLVDTLLDAVGRVGGNQRGAGGTAAGADRGGNNYQAGSVVVQNLYVTANNPRELVNAITTEAQRQAFIRTGSANIRPSRPFIQGT
jgi:hypothetical protein